MSQLEEVIDKLQSQLFAHEVILQAIMMNLDDATKEKAIDLVEHNMNAFVKGSAEGSERQKTKVTNGMEHAGRLVGKTLQIK